MPGAIAAVRRTRLVTWAGVWLMAAAIGGRPAAAQDGVTCGITYGPDGNMINLGPCGSPRRQPVHYGAVAISPSMLSTAGSHGQVSQRDAEQQALRSCRSSGSKDCVVAYWARNTCLALATSARTPGPYGAASAPDRSGAATAALAQCISRGGQGCFVRVTPCAGDDVRWPSPLPLPPGNQPGSVDSHLVGLWEHLINPGYWVLEIGPNGTYTFHSEAPDGGAPTMGTFTASNGRYIMHATTLTWDDTGTYKYQTPGTLVMTGKLGTGAWRRISANPNQ
jgi:hypothetical protein